MTLIFASTMYLKALFCLIVVVRLQLYGEHFEEWVDDAGNHGFKG